MLIRLNMYTPTSAPGSHSALNQRATSRNTATALPHQHDGNVDIEFLPHPMEALRGGTRHGQHSPHHGGEV